jgi:hypothetical protein
LFARPYDASCPPEVPIVYSSLKKEAAVSDELKRLLEMAGKISMSKSEREEQRRSFAYGNTHFENERITRDIVKQAAEKLAQDDGKKD